MKTRFPHQDSELKSPSDLREKINKYPVLQASPMYKCDKEEINSKIKQEKVKTLCYFLNNAHKKTSLEN